MRSIAGAGLPQTSSNHSRQNRPANDRRQNTHYAQGKGSCRKRKSKGMKRGKMKAKLPGQSELHNTDVGLQRHDPEKVVREFSAFAGRAFVASFTCACSSLWT